MIGPVKPSAGYSIASTRPAEAGKATEVGTQGMEGVGNNPALRQMAGENTFAGSVGQAGSTQEGLAQILQVVAQLVGALQQIMQQMQGGAAGGAGGAPAVGGAGGGHGGQAGNAGNYGGNGGQAGNAGNYGGNGGQAGNAGGHGGQAGNAGNYGGNGGNAGNAGNYGGNGGNAGNAGNYGGQAGNAGNYGGAGAMGGAGGAYGGGAGGGGSTMPVATDPQELASYLSASTRRGKGQNGNIAQKDAIGGTRFATVQDGQQFDAAVARGYAYQFAANAKGFNSQTVDGLTQGANAFFKMSPAAQTFMQVASVYKGDLAGGAKNYDNGKLKEMLKKAGYDVSRPGVGKTDIETIGAVADALDRGVITLNDVMNSGAIKSPKEYQQAIDYVQSGQFAAKLREYDSGAPGNGGGNGGQAGNAGNHGGQAGNAGNHGGQAGNAGNHGGQAGNAGNHGGQAGNAGNHGGQAGNAGGAGSAGGVTQPNNPLAQLLQSLQLIMQQLQQLMAQLNGGQAPGAPGAPVPQPAPAPAPTPGAGGY